MSIFLKDIKMLKSEFFAKHGLFVSKNFLDRELCKKIRSETSLASRTRSVKGKIRRKSTGDFIDENIRRTKIVEVSDETRSLVKARLLSLKHRLEKHFDLVLKDCQEPRFLLYRKGDFFDKHLDSNSNPTYPSIIRDRRLSAVVFLNNGTEKPKRNSYCGGSLVLYGIIDDPLWEKCGFPLIGEEGLLIVFRSDVLHEVKPVTYGDRYSIISFFF